MQSGGRGTENSGPGQAYKKYFPVALRSPIGEILVDSGSGHKILETKPQTFVIIVPLFV